MRPPPSVARNYSIVHFQVSRHASVECRIGSVRQKINTSSNIEWNFIFLLSERPVQFERAYPRTRGQSRSSRVAVIALRRTRRDATYTRQTRIHIGQIARVALTKPSAESKFRWHGETGRTARQNPKTHPARSFRPRPRKRIYIF